jgi:arsenate reductase
MLKVYTLSTCDTCRTATKWLRSHRIPFEELAIRETPPSLDELRAMLEARGGDLRRLFNTAGRDYREQKLAEKLPGLSEASALKLLAGNGNLVKRPFVTGDGVALVGFDAKAWASALGER